jgi:uncharacterized protein (DUF2252 family)
MASTVPSPAGAVAELLLPELAMLASLEPLAARLRRQAMAGDALAFARGSLALQVRWMAATSGGDGPWTWAAGDPHQGNFATLATGPLKRDGRVPVTYDLADVDDEHPAPWDWDLLRLLASVASARPGLARRDFLALAGTCLGDYARAMARVGDGDAAAALRLDLHGLPEALKELVERDNLPERRAAHLRAHVAGTGKDARLRLGAKLAADPAARADLLPALERVLAKREDLPERQLLDAARRVGAFGLSSLGRRRWLVLLRERDREGGWRPRLLELKERRPSVLARVIPATPFPAHGRPARAMTVAMGGDPYQCVLHAAAGDCLVRTRCQARSVVALAPLDAGDLRRLMQVWAQLLAAFHAAGLAGLVADAPAHGAAIAADAGRRARGLAAQAWELARFNHEAFAAFVNTRRPARR